MGQWLLQSSTVYSSYWIVCVHTLHYAGHHTQAIDLFMMWSCRIDRPSIALKSYHNLSSKCVFDTFVHDSSKKPIKDHFDYWPYLQAQHIGQVKHFGVGVAWTLPIIKTRRLNNTATAWPQTSIVFTRSYQPQCTALGADLYATSKSRMINKKIQIRVFSSPFQIPQKMSKILDPYCNPDASHLV